MTDDVYYWGQRVEIMVNGRWLPGTVETGTYFTATGAVKVRLDKPYRFQHPEMISVPPQSHFYRGPEHIRPITYAVIPAPDVMCGNDRHPDGAWHAAAPLPATWERLERIRQWWRRRQYGCGCPRDVRAAHR